MKTQRIFLLLMLVVLVFALASCGGKKAPSWFELDEDAVAEVTEYDGKYLDINVDAGLIALATNELDSDGTFKRITKVIDVTDGRVVFEMSESHASDDLNGYNQINLADYPVIAVEKHVSTTVENNVTKDKYNYEYYLIQNEGAAIQLDSRLDIDQYAGRNDLVVDSLSGVYEIKAGNKLYWVTKGDLKIISTFARIVADTYTDGFFDIMAENDGYLYSWDVDVRKDDAGVVIYNSNGIATAKYSFTPGTYYMNNGIATSTLERSTSALNPVVAVLNDGNVLVQECVEIAKEDTETKPDFVFEIKEPIKVDLKTMIINRETGEVTEVDFGYRIKEIESRYSYDETGYQAFPLKLSKKADNQAYMIPVADGALGTTVEYSVLDNNLKVKYTLPNEYLAMSGEYYISKASKEGYYSIGYVDGRVSGGYVDGRFEYPVFYNWNGEVAMNSPINTSRDRATSDLKYYYTAGGVYTADGKLAYDLEDSIFRANMMYGSVVSIYGNTICLERYNYETEADEVYVLNPEDGTTTMVADGIHTFVDSDDYDKILIIYDDMKETYTIYTPDGEVALVLADDDWNDTDYLDDGIIVYTIEYDDSSYKTFVYNYGIPEMPA